MKLAALSVMYRSTDARLPQIEESRRVLISATIAGMPLGVKALGTNPAKSGKTGAGTTDEPVSFGGVSRALGHVSVSGEMAAISAGAGVRRPLGAQRRLRPPRPLPAGERRDAGGAVRHNVAQPRRGGGSRDRPWSRSACSIWVSDS